MTFRYLIILLIVALSSCNKYVNLPDNISYVNPLLPSGPDPWVIKKDSIYYYTNTLGDRITIWKTKSMSRLGFAESKTVWVAPLNSANSYNVWAPELHFLDGKWYLYYAAGSTPDQQNQRIFVLENASKDPLEGTWEDKGKITDQQNDIYAIDPTVWEFHNKRYLIWSSLYADNFYSQSIFISEMKNPWTLTNSREVISTPQYPWEKIGYSGGNGVNEGPEILINPTGQIFLAYSASGCWTDAYSIGLMALKKDGDPLNKSNWVKNPEPVFTSNPLSKAFGPGHNSFFKSPDGTEDWILYHANSKPGQECNNTRNPRIQKFLWNADGSPDFGEPAPISLRLTRPSGEKD